VSICASGASTTKAGVASSVIVTPEYVKSLLPSGWEWLYDYLPYMRMLQIGSVSAFCAADPPTWTMPSATDFYNAATSNFVGQNNIITDFIDKVVRSYMWSTLCQCTTGTTPPPPTASTAPTGLPAINPTGVVAPPLTTPCWSYDHGPDNNHYPQNSSNNILGWTQTGNPPVYPAALNVTSVLLTISAVAGSPAAGAPQITVTWSRGSGPPTVVTSETYTVPYGPVSTHVTVRPPNSDTMSVVWKLPSSPTGTMNQINYAQDVYCDGNAPGGSQSQCCLPDPISTATLQQILEMVTLIQRQAVPFSYIPSTAHAGLTGTGTVDVSGILALVAEMTTLPPQIGDRVGTPPRLFDAGWLNLGTSDGYEQPVQLVAQNQLVVPRSAGLVTTVGYSLHYGVEMTLTELVREP
jgi:hypothetical protein